MINKSLPLKKLINKSQVLKPSLNFYQVYTTVLQADATSSYEAFDFFLEFESQMTPVPIELQKTKAHRVHRSKCSTHSCIEYSKISHTTLLSAPKYLVE
jgi:hypothetical protein